MKNSYTNFHVKLHEDTPYTKIIKFNQIQNILVNMLIEMV